MKTIIMLAAAAALTLPAAAIAAKPPQKRAEAFEALIACRAIADPAEKFACLDRTAAALESAAARGDILVVDRKQMTETKKTLFGFDLPKLSLFGGDDRKEDEVKQVEGTVASAHTDGDGRWIVRLQDGALWRQIDSNTLGRGPKPGNKVVINRNMIGSYSMRVGGQPGIKVRRSN
jgi:hypothetical protein